MLHTALIDDVRRGSARAHLVRLDLGGSFVHEAGQAVLIGKPDGDRLCPYSVASSPETAERQGRIELLVANDSPQGSRLLSTPGTVVALDGPMGTFVFPRGCHASQIVFLAGGTGIAPFRSMLPQALVTVPFPVTVLYSARDRDDFAFEDELRSLAAERRIRLTQTITRGRAGTDWAGLSGRFGPETVRAIAADPSALWFVAGPPAFVGSMRSCLAGLGVEPERVRVENWSAAAVATRPRPSPRGD